MNTIRATTIPDAWFQALDLVMTEGDEWVVDRGSYAGQKRKELDYVTIQIQYPGSRPLLPDTPAHIPPPATMEYVEEYLPYLMTDAAPKTHEAYTYGQRVAPQMEAIIQRYRRSLGSNQECISVSRPEDIELEDPPCLRSIDCRISARDPRLDFYVYFRSNDLWGGFPVNLASIAIMQEYMAESIGVPTGGIVYASKGLHVYDHVWDLARKVVKR